MNVFDAVASATEAVSSSADRPATRLMHDSPDARLVMFRLEPGQQVPSHTSPSSVVLVVSAGSGEVTGTEGARAVRPGDVVTFAPSEPHGMRALSHSLVILAIIAPRPG